MRGSRPPEIGNGLSGSVSGHRDQNVTNYFKSMTFEEKVRSLAIKAFFTIDSLVNRIVLKGGNALDIVYGLTGRASIDLDFSLCNDFSEEEIPEIRIAIERALEKSFEPEKLKTFDVKLEKKPQEDRIECHSFWGGYYVTFKVTDIANYEKNKGNFEKIRREAIVVAPGQKKNFSIDISKYEYCEKKVQKKYDGFTIYVYSLEMLAFEKLRAICQQMVEYQDVIKKRRTPRARDFYDIYVIQNASNFDLSSNENMKLIQNIFGCKKVPLSFLKLIKNYRDFHAAGYDELKSTIKANEEVKPFDFYFDFVVDLVNKIPHI